MSSILRIIIVLLICGGYANKVGAELNNKENEIHLNLTTKQVCSNRANKCWPVAIGNKTNPTPYRTEPYYILTHYKNGFDWQNPFTKQIYSKGTHNLGNIWIGITNLPNGISIGFHTTPTPSIPLNKQESLGGCVRMNPKDILEFSNNVEYLDKIYVTST